MIATSARRLFRKTVRPDHRKKKKYKNKQINKNRKK